MLKATPVNASKKDLMNNLEDLESGSDESEEDEMTPGDNNVEDLIKQAKEGISGVKAPPASKKAKRDKKGKPQPKSASKSSRSQSES